MKLDDFENDNNKGSLKFTSSLGYSLVLASMAVLIVLLCVLVINKDKLSEKDRTENTAATVSSSSYQFYTATGVDDYISGSTLTAEDLDFWHDYDEEEEQADDYPQVSAVTAEEDTAEEESDPALDGKHTLITYSDGSQEWIDINPYLELNNYDYSNLVYVNSLMKYYDNQVNTSFAGVMISKDEDYVDFDKLKKAGIDFCMLKVGGRGYSSGDLLLDENFYDNFTRALNADLEVGLYFQSYAITKEEAVEEAEFVLNSISENSISVTYPIVFCLEEADNNNSRTSGLSQMQRTNIAIAFMDTIKDAGYIPAIYGTKEYLLKRISFGSLIGYDVWLAQDRMTPDFPYNFQMWRFTSTGKIDGIAGYSRLLISFTDYSIG